MTPDPDNDFEVCKASALHEGDFFGILTCEDTRAAPFFVNALRGRHGPGIALSAQHALLDGVGYGGDLEFVQPIADFLLMERRLPMLKSVVLAGAPHGLLENRLSGPAPVNPRLAWLELLSALPQPADAEEDVEPAYLDYAAMRELKGCAGAVELLWELAPNHPDFARLAADPSAEGAVVRQFLMTKQLQAGASNDVDVRARPVVQRLRAHRARV